MSVCCIAIAVIREHWWMQCLFMALHWCAHGFLNRSRQLAKKICSLWTKDWSASLIVVYNVWNAINYSRFVLWWVAYCVDIHVRCFLYPDATWDTRALWHVRHSVQCQQSHAASSLCTNTKDSLRCALGTIWPTWTWAASRLPQDSDMTSASWLRMLCICVLQTGPRISSRQRGWSITCRSHTILHSLCSHSFPW